MTTSQKILEVAKLLPIYKAKRRECFAKGEIYKARRLKGEIRKIRKVLKEYYANKNRPSGQSI